MDDNSILARLITGAAIKLIGAGIAIWVAVTVATYVTHVFTTVSAALPH